MIKLHITTKNFELTEKVQEYAEHKIGRLDRFMPRGTREIEGRVILEVDPSGREDNKYICEAMLELPGPNAEAKEATLNIFAAIDIVEAKLRTQVKKFKDKHAPSRLRRSKEVWGRLFGGPDQ